MLEIPLNGKADAVFEHGFRLPAEVTLNLVRSNGITTVVTFAVRNVGD